MLCSMQVVMAYAFATAALLGVFWVSPNVAWIQWLIVAAVGFALYGPQMLIGLCGAEVVRKPAVSAAQGFLGWISYLGAQSWASCCEDAFVARVLCVSLPSLRQLGRCTL